MADSDSPDPADPADLAAPDPYRLADAAAAAIRAATGVERHEVAVVLGSGWAPAAGELGRTVAELPMAQLPGFPALRVPGHLGLLRSVDAAGVPVLVLLGRVHAYEGHPLPTVVHGVRTAVRAGCRVVVLTNAAGGIHADLAVGQPVLVADHLNLTGRSPLAGVAAPASYGVPRFLDLTDLYAARLRALARSVDSSLTDGVYAALPGPHYETPAEIRMLRTMGADLVGMSTALEAIAAHHLGASVLGISLVTNLAAGVTGQPLDHREVIEAGVASATRMGRLLADLIPRLHESPALGRPC